MSSSHHITLKKKQPPEVFYKRKAALKNFAIFTGKQLCWGLSFIKLQTFRPATLSKRDCNIGVLLSQSFCVTAFLKNICLRLLLNRLHEVIVWNYIPGQLLSKLSWLSNITKLPVALNQSFKHDSVHMLSLYLTPTLPFERRFCMFIISGYYTKCKGLQSLDSLLVYFLEYIPLFLDEEGIIFK